MAAPASPSRCRRGSSGVRFRSIGAVQSNPFGGAASHDAGGAGVRNWLALRRYSPPPGMPWPPFYAVASVGPRTSPLPMSAQSLVSTHEQGTVLATASTLVLSTPAAGPRASGTPRAGSEGTNGTLKTCPWRCASAITRCEGAAAVDPHVPGGPALGAGHFGRRDHADYGAMPFFRSSSIAWSVFWR